MSLRQVRVRVFVTRFRHFSVTSFRRLSVTGLPLQMRGAGFCGRFWGKFCDGFRDVSVTGFSRVSVTGLPDHALAHARCSLVLRTHAGSSIRYVSTAHCVAACARAIPHAA
eukprot:3941817-Rhodomonas_salina.1